MVFVCLQAADIDTEAPEAVDIVAVAPGTAEIAVVQDTAVAGTAVDTAVGRVGWEVDMAGLAADTPDMPAGWPFHLTIACLGLLQQG